MPPFIAQPLRELKRRLSLRMGERLKDVRLYGSWARGEPRVGSDIDVLVVVQDLTEDDRHLVFEVDAQLLVESGVAFSVHVMSTQRLEFLIDKEVGYALDLEREGISA